MQEANKNDMGWLIDGLIIWFLLLQFGKIEIGDWPLGLAHALGIMVVNVLLSVFLSDPFVLFPCLIVADVFYLMSLCALTLKQAVIAVTVLIVCNVLLSMVLYNVFLV